jgi:hypothetical protein
LLSTADRADDPPYDISSGLWEKAYACLLNGASNDTPDLTILERGGTANAALGALTGTAPQTYVSNQVSDEFVLRLRQSVDARGAGMLAAVGSTAERISGWRGDANLSPGHAYSILGVVDSGTSRYVIVNNPTRMRDTSNASLPWGVLADVPWLASYSVAACGNQSGVVPLGVDLFLEAFGYVDAL